MKSSLLHAAMAACVFASATGVSLAPRTVMAQGAATSPAPVVEGTMLDGRPFKLSAFKGKVVLLMFWSTDCAVCLDKMPELRRNYEGWATKPFEMVLVSMDRRMKDIEDYDALISRTVPTKLRFVQLWAGQPGYRDNLVKPAPLPATFLLDKQGKVVKSYSGRIPADAWDDIAELLL